MRKWIRGPLTAATFAFLILFMNLFPLVGMALPINYEAPQYEAPNWETPNIQAPNWEQPNLQVPNWEQPNPEAPNWNPNLQAPNWEQPNLQAPNVNQPNPQAPNVPVPNVQAPQVQPPSADPNSNEPFGESLGYGAIKWSFKDVIGGTLSYTSNLLMAGEVDMSAGVGGRGLFLFDLTVKGLDLAFKDNPYVKGYTGAGVDVLDGMNTWANYKYVLSQMPNSSFSNFLQGGQLTNSGNPVRVPGIVKGFNVGVAAISLPFDIVDTYTNFSGAFDPSNSEAEQNEKFVDGVGNFGSVLMDAGVIATVIPGMQTVAGVLFVTGAVLWGVSKLVKYADKLAGGAITNGIRKGVGKVTGWVKSLFA